MLERKVEVLRAAAVELVERCEDASGLLSIAIATVDGRAFTPSWSSTATGEPRPLDADDASGQKSGDAQPDAVPVVPDQPPPEEG